MIRVGQGYDVHKFEEGRPLIIGGITIPHDRGLTGHSDADVLLHTVTDAALGAIGEGDIGRHFPDTDAAFKDADSAVLLEKIWSLVEGKRIQTREYRLHNHRAKTENGTAYRDHPCTYCGIVACGCFASECKSDDDRETGLYRAEEGIAALATILLMKA